MLQELHKIVFICSYVTGTTFFHRITGSTYATVVQSFTFERAKISLHLNNFEFGKNKIKSKSKRLKVINFVNFLDFQKKVIKY